MLMACPDSQAKLHCINQVGSDMATLIRFVSGLSLQPSNAISDRVLVRLVGALADLVHNLDAMSTAIMEGRSDQATQHAMELMVRMRHMPDKHPELSHVVFWPSARDRMLGFLEQVAHPNATMPTAFLPMPASTVIGEGIARNLCDTGDPCLSHAEMLENWERAAAASNQSIASPPPPGST